MRFVLKNAGISYGSPKIGMIPVVVSGKLLVNLTSSLETTEKNIKIPAGIIILSNIS